MRLGSEISRVPYILTVTTHRKYTEQKNPSANPWRMHSKTCGEWLNSQAVPNPFYTIVIQYLQRIKARIPHSHHNLWMLKCLTHTKRGGVDI